MMLDKITSQNNGLAKNLLDLSPDSGLRSLAVSGALANGSRGRTVSSAKVSAKPMKIPHPTRVAFAEYIFNSIRNTGGRIAAEMLEDAK